MYISTHKPSSPVTCTLELYVQSKALHHVSVLNAVLRAETHLCLFVDPFLFGPFHLSSKEVHLTVADTQTDTEASVHAGTVSDYASWSVAYVHSVMNAGKHL